MKTRSLLVRLAASTAQIATMLAVAMVAGASAQNPYPQQQPGYPQQSGQSKPAGQTSPQASDAELQAAKKVQSAPDPATALQAAAEFVKKYPKSEIMMQVARITAGKIAALTDANQKVTFSETYQNTFKSPEYEDIILPTLVDGLTKANRTDEAFQKADAYLQRHPDDVAMLTQMALVGAELIRSRNTKYVPQAQKYGASAIALIEADKKPADLSDADWTQYKTKWLGQLYQSSGLLAMVAGDQAGAKGKLEKAIAANPYEPFSYLLLGQLANNQYQVLANQYKSMVPGAEQEAALKKALEQMDQIIDYYAHAVALSEGIPQYKQLHDQVMQDLETFYKYRHKSADGLQQLIDKYKKPANG